VLPTEKSLVTSFWTFFKFLGNQGELAPKIFVDAGWYLSKVNL